MLLIYKKPFAFLAWIEGEETVLRQQLSGGLLMTFNQI